MKKNILIIGSHGFIGKHLAKSIQPKYYTSRKGGPYTLDLAKPSLKTLPLNEISHGIIAAACTNIPYCEKFPQETHQINVQGTLDVVKELVDHGTFPIVLSSDYVFDGVKGDYTEASPLSPINSYGKQKAELECRIGEITNGNHLILRLSKIYSLERDDGTLLDEMASTLNKGLPLQVATDQIFCPLSIIDLVKIVLQLIENNHVGLYNLGSLDKVSRFHLAKTLASALKLPSTKVIPIQLNSLNPSFSRPLNTSLCSEKIFNLLDYTPLSVKQAITTIANNFKCKENCTRSEGVFPMKPGDSATDFEANDDPIAAGAIGEK